MRSDACGYHAHFITITFSPGRSTLVANWPSLITFDTSNPSTCQSYLLEFVARIDKTHRQVLHPDLVFGLHVRIRRFCAVIPPHWCSAKYAQRHHAGKSCPQSVLQKGGMHCPPVVHESRRLIDWSSRSSTNQRRATESFAKAQLTRDCRSLRKPKSHKAARNGSVTVTTVSIEWRARFSRLTISTRLRKHLFFIHARD